MKLARSLIEFLIYGLSDPSGDEDSFEELPRRFTQDSPVLADVWIRYGQEPRKAQELLLTPQFGSTAGQVSRVVRDRLEGERRQEASVAYNQTYVAASLEFDELVGVVLPMTRWWQQHVLPAMDELRKKSDWRASLAEALRSYGEERREGVPAISSDLLWMIRIVGSIAWARTQGGEDDEGEAREIDEVPEPDAIIAGIQGFVDAGPADKPTVWQVNINRKTRTAVRRSTLAIKADAARLLFKVHCHELTWAVIDSGIDARHPAFWDWDGRTLVGTEQERRKLRERLKELREDADFEADSEDEEFWPTVTRVKATYDFTRARELLDANKLKDPTKWPPFVKTAIERAAEEAGEEAGEEMEATVRALAANLEAGRSVDWGLAEPFLRVPHDRDYDKPRSEHGTHVAGILAAHWPHEELEGVCPDINLYDMRVLKRGASNDEFAVLAALQFVNHLNDQKDLFRVHGVNLSLAIRHDVANFACGRTPVCDECERTIAGGVVVVAAAGNEGYLQYVTSTGRGRTTTTEGYHTVSITDPGNAAKVITVGSTHRFQPHTYGVSYFSSRGPTGDGRIKPDLVAPGEKVDAPVPNGELRTKDGTSMAAPHASGAAAMLMARHTELIGQPERIKEVLCDTATDLGRERYFQGAGMLDVLRAIQSV